MKEPKLHEEPLTLKNGQEVTVKFYFYPPEYDGPFLVLPPEYDLVEVTSPDGQELTDQEINQIELDLLNALEERRRSRSGI